MKEDFSIELDRDEFYVLLAQFGPTDFLGMTDPFRGFLSEEIALATDRAHLSLLSRQLVRIGEGEVLIEQPLESALRICAHPEHSLIIQAQIKNEPERRIIIHFRDDMILEQVEQKSGRYRLTTVENRETLLSRLGDLIGLDSKKVGSGKSFRVEEALLLEIRSLCIDGHLDEAVGKLKEIVLSDAQYSPLVETLVAPLANTSFALVANRNNLGTQYVRGFAVLESEDYLWILQPSDVQGKKQVEIIPATSAMVMERLVSILH